MYSSVWSTATTPTSPSSTCEPDWLNSVSSLEMAELEWMAFWMSPGPSTVWPAGSSYTVSWPYVPGSDEAVMKAVRFWLDPDAEMGTKGVMSRKLTPCWPVPGSAASMYCGFSRLTTGTSWPLGPLSTVWPSGVLTLRTPLPGSGETAHAWAWV